MKKVSTRKWLLALGAPLLVIALAEGIFALVGWFEPCRLLLPTQHLGQTYLYTNPEFGRLFLPRRDLPMPSPVWVRQEKPDGVLRIVLLGESAAAGFPHPEFNLARAVEHVWRARHTNQPLEVINLTMVGVNSHILRGFAREARQLAPDAFILYAGHNEAIGPYGPASVFGRHVSSMSLTRLNLWVRNLRVGRALDSGYRWWIRVQGRSLPAWMGLEEFRETPIADDDPRLEVMARHVSENYHDLVAEAVRHDIRVLVTVPAVNLTDWPPLGSAETRLTDSDALTAWKNGQTNALVSAQQVYRLAKTSSATGDWDLAWPLYRRALDLDLFRFRADRRVRDALLSLSDAFPPDQVSVVDTDMALHERNPLFMTDREYFCEHVHLTFPGRALVSSILADGLMNVLGYQPLEGVAMISVSELAKRMLFTPIDEYSIWQEVWTLMSLGVFADQPDQEERRSYISSTTVQLRDEIKKNWNPITVSAAYEQAHKQHPDDPMIDMIAGRILMEMGARDLSKSALDKGLSQWPTYHSAWVDLASVSMLFGNMPEAELALAKAELYSVDNPRLPAIKGEFYARSGDFAKAQHYLEISVSNRPTQVKTMINLANVYALRAMNKEAISMYGRCVALNESDPLVLNNLAWLLVTSEDTSPESYPLALHYAQRAITLQSGIPRYLATLALAQAANQNTQEAIHLAETAIMEMTEKADHEGVAMLTNALRRWSISL